MVRVEKIKEYPSDYTETVFKEVRNLMEEVVSDNRNKKPGVEAAFNHLNRMTE